MFVSSQKKESNTEESQVFGSKKSQKKRHLLALCAQEKLSHF
jgi:hypothetical protein